jgi:hypothetical protein
MYGFEVHDEMAANGSMHFRVIRTLLTANLPKMIPELRILMQDGFAKEVLQGSIKDDG